MTRRGQQPMPPMVDIDRLMARIERGQNDLRDRVEILIDGVDNRLARIEKDVANGQMETSSLSREIAEVRRDLGEGREAVALLRQDMDAHKRSDSIDRRAVAAGVAAVAVTTADSIFARLVKNGRIQWFAIIASTIATLAWAGSQGPGIFRLAAAAAKAGAVFIKGVAHPN